MNQENFFDTIAHRWDAITDHDSHKIRQLLSLLEIKENMQILDVGCGTGVLVPFLNEKLENTGKIIEIDTSEEMLKINKEKHDLPNLEFIWDDPTRPGFIIEKLDAVICYSMFPHFTDKTHAIERLITLLKDKGTLSILHSQSRNEINQLHKDLENQKEKEARLPSMAELNSMFKANGLEVIHQIDTPRLFGIVGKKG